MNKKRLAVTILLFVIGLALFLVMYDSVQGHDDLARFDMPVLDWMMSHRTPTLTTIMQTVTTVMSPTTLAAIVLIGSALWAWRKQEFWRPTLLVASMGAVLVLGTLIKHVTQRQRPPIVDMIQPFEIDYSFPSGHTLGIAACLLVLGYLLYSRKPRLHSMLMWVVITIAGVALVAGSRLYLGYHWITDVSASVGLALIILSLIITVDTYRPNWTRLQRPTKGL
jgi:undecaprenyl-diphosphatase